MYIYPWSLLDLRSTNLLEALYISHTILYSVTMSVASTTLRPVSDVVMDIINMLVLEAGGSEPSEYEVIEMFESHRTSWRQQCDSQEEVDW